VPECVPARRGRQNKKLVAVARCAALGQISDEETALEEEAEVDQALAAFGLVATRVVESLELLHLWPENVATWNLFQALCTQWVCGMAGATGLNYQSVNIVMAHWAIPRGDRRRVFDEIQAMERATLSAWGERKK
jgi:hypothetical protein